MQESIQVTLQYLPPLVVPACSKYAGTLRSVIPIVPYTVVPALKVSEYEYSVKLIGCLGFPKEAFPFI